MNLEDRAALDLHKYSARRVCNEQSGMSFLIRIVESNHSAQVNRIGAGGFVEREGMRLPRGGQQRQCGRESAGGLAVRRNARQCEWKRAAGACEQDDRFRSETRPWHCCSHHPAKSSNGVSGCLRLIFNLRFKPIGPVPVSPAEENATVVLYRQFKTHHQWDAVFHRDDQEGRIPCALSMASTITGRNRPYESRTPGRSRRPVRAGPCRCARRRGRRANGSCGRRARTGDRAEAAPGREEPRCRPTGR